MKDNCKKRCQPETDDSTIDCDGEYIDAKCITVAPVSYLGIEENDSQDTVNAVLTEKLKTLTNFIGNLWNLPEYDSDSEAEADGILIGEPYVTTVGVVRIRKV